MRVFLNHIKIQLNEGNPLIYSIDIQNLEKIQLDFKLDSQFCATCPI